MFAKKAATRITGSIVVLTLVLGSVTSASAARSDDNRDSAANRTTSMTDVVHQIGADRFWAAGFDGEGVDVALIDTGIAPVEALSGPDKVVNGPDLSFDGGMDELAGLDGYGHGTHIAGIIAGHTPGADPLAPSEGDFLGVAPGARIVNVKVGDHAGAVDVSQVIAAIDWVVQNRRSGDLDIRVLNLSYNTSSLQDSEIDPLSFAIDNAWNHGIVVVVAAGNEGRGAHRLANPATNPRIIAVSSSRVRRNSKESKAWTIPSWAPSGDGVRNPDLLAPGLSIASLRVPGGRLDNENPTAVTGADSELFLGSGTSQSTAIVSGAAALLIDQRPELSPDEVKAILQASAHDLGRKEAVQGSGGLDLGAALGLPTPTELQAPHRATGLGSLEAARGDDHVSVDGVEVVGEYTVMGAEWDPITWSGTSWSGTSWSGTSWSGTSWSGTSWSGLSWR